MSAASKDREIELKLGARSADLPKIKRAVNAATGGSLRWQTKNMVSRYFDTADQQLARHGVSLRLRQVDGKFIQTLKSRRTGGGVMDRNEWEFSVETPELDLANLPAEARAALGAVTLLELAPVIEVDLTRQVSIVRRANPIGSDLAVEIALDKGRVNAGGKSEPFAECELELLDGDVEHFFRFAAEVHTQCPLAISAVTKAGRGNRLLAGEGPKVHWLPKFQLNGSQTVHDALTEIFSACLTNIIANEEACMDGSDPEGVHQMRVSIRRLRSSLKVFRAFLDTDRVTWLADELKWLGNELGPARDWDVYIDETLGDISSYGIDDDAKALLDSAKARRGAAYDQVRATLQSARYRSFIFRLAAFVATQGWLPRPFDQNDPLFKLLDKAAAETLRKPYRKLIKECRNLADLEPKGRHDVRIRLKRLRYGVDFLQAIYPGGRTRKFVKALKNLQDQFGKLNDVAEAMRMTEELTTQLNGTQIDPQIYLAGGQVRGWHARSLREAEPELMRDWDAFTRSLPFWEDPKSWRRNRGGSGS